MMLPKRQSHRNPLPVVQVEAEDADVVVDEEEDKEEEDWNKEDISIRS